jgi:hypothetical protein
MEILAVNKPRHDYKWFEHSNSYCIFRVLVMLAMFVCCIIGVWSVWVDSEAPKFLIVYPLVLAIFGFYMYETPEKLCVFYARHRHYSLGIHMQYKEIEALEKRIMQLARGN